MFGCGWLGIETRYSFSHTEQGGFDLVKGTCPEYYACQPAVREVYELFSDYKRGALGDVRKLSAPLLEGLRVLDYEQVAFDNHMLESG